MPDSPNSGAAISVAPGTGDDWADVVTVMGGADSERGCWCQYYRLSSGEYARSGTLGGHRGRLREQLAGDPAPGIIARIDGEPVGWCGLWPRHRFERLVRSRTIPAVDDQPVWSIVCFLVRAGYRRRGVARALLAGAIDYARAQGAPALEAYPVDPEGGRVDVAFGYVGFTPMFEAAGFRRVQATDARSDRRIRWLMRLDLAVGEARARAAR